jgi:hypothetical protein
MDFYYHGVWRMDWGLGNPNKTAALIACLMITIWTIAYMWRRGFWFILPIFTALGWCLVQTYSRGGMLALLAGIAILLVWTPRPWPKARWIAVGTSLWIVGFFILYARAEARYGQGLFAGDQSINSRLVIWKQLPEMLAAAPWGWGWGKAGDSYTQWFQPADQSVNYLNLINSHFTWMVEGGWIFSVLYAFTWAVILLLCWPTSESCIKAVPMAVWIAFGVSGFFSHVEESVWLWILPLLFLGYAVWNRFHLKQWPTLLSVGLGGLISTCVVAGLILIGFVGASLPIKATDGAVVLGRGPDINVIFVDRAVMGKLYGHTLRRFLAKNRDWLSDNTYIVSESPDYVTPASMHEMIVSGQMMHDAKVASDLNHSDQIILINPDCFPNETKWVAGMASKTSVYFGEYSQSPARSSWVSYPIVKSLLIDGASDFVPSWPQAVWKPTGT